MAKPAHPAFNHPTEGDPAEPSRSAPATGAHFATSKKSPTKKPPQGVAFRGLPIQRINAALEQKFYLASSYFCRGLPPNYRRRCCVSQPSSRWIGVGPQRHGHQDRNQPKLYSRVWFRFCPQVNPENCIGNGNRVPVVNSTSR